MASPSAGKCTAVVDHGAEAAEEPGRDESPKPETSDPEILRAFPGLTATPERFARQSSSGSW